MKLRLALLGLLLGAVLVGPGTARAVAIVFDVSGTSAEQNSQFYTPEPPGYHETEFSAGSSLTLETDADGDGVSGDYTIVDSHFAIHGYYQVQIDLGLGESWLTWDFVGELRGGSGRWDYDVYGYPYIRWIDTATYSLDGTWQCYGWACAYEGLPEGVPMPAAEMLAFMGMESIEAVALGSWSADGLIPTEFSTACLYADPSWCHSGGEAGFLVAVDVDYDGGSIMLYVEGQAVPEPTSGPLAGAALLALALGRGLSLRGCSSDTMRRHEVA